VESDPPPIAFDYRLRCNAGEAFTAYTGQIGEWWDRRYSASPDTLETVTIEPGVGGRVYATHSDLGEHEWGEVTVWEQGRRLAHTFWLAQDPGHPTRVSVEFEPDADGGCTMRFAHGGWTAETAETRAKFGDWQLLLDRFAALADAEG
jgi:Activator of Hsp90 ATPase homolog 1-like protein